jgi:hypothetical protein
VRLTKLQVLELNELFPALPLNDIISAVKNSDVDFDKAVGLILELQELQESKRLGQEVKKKKEEENAKMEKERKQRQEDERRLKESEKSSQPSQELIQKVQRYLPKCLTQFCRYLMSYQIFLGWSSEIETLTPLQTNCHQNYHRLWRG